MFKDTPDGQTNYCTHTPNGICDDCLNPQEDWKGTCGTPIYDKDKNIIAVCGVINCQTHKSRQEDWRKEWLTQNMNTGSVIQQMHFIQTLLISQEKRIREEMNEKLIGIIKEWRSEEPTETDLVLENILQALNNQ